MSSNNNNNKKTQTKKQQNNNKSFFKTINPFRMDIEDDIYDPFKNDMFGFDHFESQMFKNFRNMFTDFGLLSEHKKEEEKEEPEVKEEPKEVKEVKEVKEEKPKDVQPMEEEKEEEINTDSKKEEPKIEEINTNTKVEEEINTDKKEEEKEINTDKKEEEEHEQKTNEKEEKKYNDGSFYSKVYYSSYNNLNGEPHQESYQSQTIKQTNNGHNISETKEAYKNSNGVVKSAYQRNLDDKTTRFIKEKNLKTGKHNQKKVIKGIEENDINDFNKEYNEYSKKCGFKKNYHKLNAFNPFYPFGFNKKLISDGDSNIFLHKLLF